MVGAEVDEKCLSQYDKCDAGQHIVESCKLSLNVSLAVSGPSSKTLLAGQGSGRA
ncbi:conserved hypothetical protein [Histoplasma capsulatum H143]|uniref:Uncharacterized protein n=1 Tax=Ajellomyces capsulatus (strain H143) TaxID=544712 RepID=C6HLK0_AJECH|nr:conserved hypothetical protein [Histoplasma capsulatum H143]